MTEEDRKFFRVHARMVGASLRWVCDEYGGQNELGFKLVENTQYVTFYISRQERSGLRVWLRCGDHSWPVPIHSIEDDMSADSWRVAIALP